MMPMEYRPDVDGLRAIAVLGVVLYHAGFSAFSGGFVGVDVFFVISGFLITRLIVQEIRDGSFSFSAFYIRRARRLFPAFFFTLSVCLIVAFFLFTPNDFRDFSGSLFSSLISLSNIFFWQQSGYFDGAALSKPLLHTWSLSVEEQFYLVWPMVLVLLMLKTPKWFAPLAIVVGGLLSLLLSALFAGGFFLSSVPALHDGPATIFYLAPFRVFEFAIGASILWLLPYQPPNRLLSEALLPLGIAMIGYSIFAFYRGILFPSVNALIPCIGAALVIYGGTSKYSSKLVINPLAVRIGLISYSLYLVHWPLIVFYQYFQFRELGLTEKLIVCGLAIGAAEIMHRYIEQPFRHRKAAASRLSNAVFFAGSAVLASTVAVVAADAWRAHGWMWRFPPQVANQLAVPVAQHEKFSTANAKLISGRYADTGARKVLIIGDSQASDLVNILFAHGIPDDVDLRLLRVDADCQPMFGIAPHEFVGGIPGGCRTACERQHRDLRRDERIPVTDTVILAASWRPWSATLVPRVVASLRTAGVKSVFLLGPKTQVLSGPQRVLRQYLRGPGYVELLAPRVISDESLAINDVLRGYSVSHDVVFVDMYDALCSGDRFCDYLTATGDVIFWDQLHLTPQGAQYFERKLKDNALLTILRPDDRARISRAEAVPTAADKPDQ